MLNFQSSFELDGVWTLSGNASRSTEQPRLGVYSLKQIVRSAFGGSGGLAVSPAIRVQPGAGFPWSYWVNLQGVNDTPSGWCSLEFGYIPAGGAETELETLTLADKIDGEYHQRAGELLVPGGVEQLQLYFRAAFVDPTPAPAEDWFFVDDVSAGGEMLTKALRDALVLDLQDVDGTGEFTHDLTAGTISDEGMVSSATVVAPAAFIMPGTGGNADQETMGNVNSLGEQYFQLQLVVKSAAPHGDGMNLLDDVRNAVERPSSNVLAVKTDDYEVRFAGIATWTEVYTSEALGNDYGQLDAAVRVQYVYKHGEL